MAREWGVIRAKFWEQDEPFVTGSPVTVNGKSYIDSIVDGSVNWTRLMSQVGFGSVSFYETENWANLAAPGRVCVVEQVGSHFSGGARLLACFLVEDIEPQVRNGLNVVELRGPGLESLLNKQLAWGVIGTAVVTGTTLVASVAGPDARSMANDSPPGVDFVILDESSSEDIDQEIRIELDNGSWFVTVITDRINVDGNMCLILRDKLPWSAFIGSPVEIRQRRIRVANVAPFVEGATVSVTVSGGGSFQTLVAGQLGTSDRVLIEDGLPNSAAAGAAVTVTATSTPTTSDVSQIIAHAPGWTAYFQTGQGTAGGSYHTPRGESVFEMLSSLAERTGEFFRQRVLTAPNAPTKSIDWRRTPDSSGITLYMYDDGDYDQQAADEMILTRGAIFSLRHRRSLPLLTRVFPSAGDQQIVLTRCSQAALNYAAAHGCSILPGVGLYEEDSVVNDAAVASHGYHEAQITYGDISISDAKDSEALTSACDQLLISAVQTLVTAQERKYYTIDAYIPAAVMPGQTIKIYNQSNSAPRDGGATDWIVLEVTERVVSGRTRTTLTVSNMTGLRWTPANIFATRLRSVIQSQRRVAASGGNTTIMSGGTGGEVGDHGALTGLTDDDHAQYLRTDGTRTLTGNLSTNAGVTIDGVDISAHAADPSAHHAPVTAADTSITVTGQAIRIANAVAGDGINLTGGVLSVKTSTALGTKIVTDVVGVDAWSDGGLFNGANGLQVKLPSTAGLEVDAAGVKVKLPASSGLVKDATGLYAVAPGTLSATSTNSRDAGTHAVTATDNAKTTVGTLLKGSAAGDLTLRWVTADKVVTPLVETASGALTLNPASGKTINDGNLEFTGARSITTDTGSLTLAPAQTLVLDPADDVARVAATTTLKTAHAAVGVFPQTGWQVDYDGHGYFTSLLADELIVQSFIADLMRVKVGGEYIPESMALIRRDFTIPAVGATGTLYVEDIPGWADIAAFAEGDWVMLRIVDRSGGGLVVAAAWGQVTGYTDRTDGEQSWTFTTRVATAAVGETAHAGDLALDYGKVGSSWYYVTVTDPGGPHAGFASWYGASPADNPEYWLRMGQLKGISGRYERGFQTGLSNSSFTRLSELGNEIHGSRLSLYAGDGGKLQLSAVDVVFYRTAGASSTLVPDGDGTAVNVDSTTAAYYTAIDEGAAAPNHNDYIANRGNLSGMVFLSLTNPAAFTSIYRIDIVAAVKSTGLSNDTVRLYGQVFQSDEATPLTGEVLLVTRTTNTTTTVTVTAPHTGYGTGGAGTSDWNGARLRLRWEYEINANEEAIRLDPAVPSLAVGNPLPTGLTTGGAGLWAGLDGSAYKARLGDPLGARLTYDGNGLQLVSGSTGAQIVLNPTAQSIALGNPLPTGVETGGAGIWMGFLDGAYKLRVGNVGGTALRWDGTDLYLRNAAGDRVIELTGAGASSFAGPMTIGTAGGIWQGTGTFASPTTGLKIWNASGIGRLATYKTGIKQIELDSDGKLVIGDYGMTLDKNGMSIYPNGVWSGGDAGIRFLTPAGTQFGKLYNYAGTGFYSVLLSTEIAGHTAGLGVGTHATGTHTRAYLYADTTVLTLSSDNTVAELSNADFYIKERGLAIGYTTTPSLNRGQIASDLAGEHDFNTVVLQDTGTIAHGMTTIANTATYGALSKFENALGGLDVQGFSESVGALELLGHGGAASTTKTTGSLGGVVVTARLKSGTSAGSYGANGNLLVVRNNTTTRLIVDAEGDLHIDGTSNTYDSFNDVALLRAADLALAGHDIDKEYGHWLEYNRADLERLGLVSAGGFVNVTRMQRVITGAIWQSYERIAAVEKRLGQAGL